MKINKSGITLIEVIVSFAIVSVVLVLMMHGFTSVSSLRIQDTKNSVIESDVVNDIESASFRDDSKYDKIAGHSVMSFRVTGAGISQEYTIPIDSIRYEAENHGRGITIFDYATTSSITN
ncbi:MAG: type II secretion system GspH family protein [Clostridiales Family XIII bacterium]|jgi:type II secretory pathway pseudopilin PulG|nr:type II secretion system GspH family protein [Clostridiales Family XIII bacterium]